MNKRLAMRCPAPEVCGYVCLLAGAVVLAAIVVICPDVLVLVA